MANAAYNIPNDAMYNARFVAGAAGAVAGAGVRALKGGANAANYENARMVAGAAGAVAGAAGTVLKGGANMYLRAADPIAGAAVSALKGGANLYLRATDPIAAKIEPGIYNFFLGRSEEHRDVGDVLNSLRGFVQASMPRRRMRGKQPPLGPGKAYIQNHDDTDHLEMSYSDVEGWMSSTQNKDELIQNLFKRTKFREWLYRNYGNVDERHIFRSLHEFTPEALATMLVILDHHS